MRALLLAFVLWLLPACAAWGEVTDELRYSLAKETWYDAIRQTPPDEKSAKEMVDTMNRLLKLICPANPSFYGCSAAGWQPSQPSAPEVH